MVTILRTLPYLVLSPSSAAVFWLVVLLIASQYRRLAASEERAYGVSRMGALEALASGVLYGILGGFVASVLLVFIGVSLSGSGIGYLLPLAFLLYLVSPRLMCYSYAGGLVSFSYLLFGFPKVNVSGIMTLVAVLHMAESILIRVSGAGCSTPVFVRNRKGEVVGGYSLQRFWPVPLVVLLFVMVQDLSQVDGLIQMPDWWPLVGGEEARGVPNALFAMVPVVAALGYSDISLTCSPQERVKKTSGLLAAYSLSLLLVSLASTRHRPLEWLAALMGPLGHELVVAVGIRREMSGEPRFIPPGKGVMILDVLPGSPAAAAGLRRGDVITEVSGVPVNSRDELNRAVEMTPVFLEVTVDRPGEDRERTVRFRGVVERLGIITVPEEGDQPNVEIRHANYAWRFAKTLRRRLFGFLERWRRSR